MVFYSIHFNRPDFIYIQYEYIKKIGDRLVIINNSCDPKINQVCSELNIECYNNPNGNKYFRSCSHASGLNMVHSIMDTNEDWGLIDHDLFIYKNIDLGDYDLMGSLQERSGIKYLWPGCLIGKKHISLRKIDFMPQGPGDTGFATNIWFKNNLKISFTYDELLQFNSDGFTKVDFHAVSDIQGTSTLVKINDFAIHYLNGSGWFPADATVVNEKNSLIRKFLEKEISK